MTVNSPTSYNAFISYARADGRDLAERLYLALKDHNLHPWRDERDLNPYQDFSVGIERAIRASRYIVVLLTPSIATREDSFVRREIIFAQGRKKPIIPIVCSDYDPADVPVLINHLEWMKLVDFDADFPLLLERFGSLSQTFVSPTTVDEPFRAHLEELLDFVVHELETSILNIDDMMLLTGKDTPSAIPRKALLSRYKSRVLVVNSPSIQAEQIFANFSDSFMAHDGRVLLLGEPGAGKTTTVLAFTREKIYERLANPLALLPIYAPLSSWDGKTELTDWLATYAGLDPAALRREIAANRALLILDGLDELASSWHDPDKKDAEPRDFRLEFLEKLKPLDTAALISCRVKDYDDIVAKGGEKIALNGAVTLQPLLDEQIKVYLHDQPELWDALQSDPALLDMARTPLLLTLLAIGYRDSTQEERAQLRDLSASPGDLRDQIFETYIQKRYEHEENRTGEKLPYTLEGLTTQLGRAAMNVLANIFHPDSTKISQDDMGGVDNLSLAEFSVRLHLLQDAGWGVIDIFSSMGRQRYWRFLHLRFRDYLAFQYALNALNATDPKERAMAAVTLGEMRDPRAINVLRELLADKAEFHHWQYSKNKYVSDYAAEALERITMPNSLTALEAWQRDQGNDP